MEKTSAEPLVQIRGLRTYFEVEDKRAWAVDGVSFDIQKSETLGIVGESGSGKSVTALSLMRLIPDPPGRIAEGEILFGGKDLLSLDDAAVRDLRGRDIAPPPPGRAPGEPPPGGAVRGVVRKGNGSAGGRGSAGGDARAYP